MMVFVSVVIAILAVEIFIRLPVITTTTQLLNLVKKVLTVIQSPKISDHWKEKVLLRYSLDLAVMAWKIAFLLLFLGLAIAGTTFALDWLIGNTLPTIEFLLTWQGLTIATITSLAYYFVRQRIV